MKVCSKDISFGQIKPLYLCWAVCDADYDEDEDDDDEAAAAGNDVDEQVIRQFPGVLV